jgi:hypothetical protein
MKKIISLLGILFVLSLLMTLTQTEAYRGSGGSRSGSGAPGGDTGSGGSRGGSGTPGGSTRQGPGGPTGQDRHRGLGGSGTPGGFTGQGPGRSTGHDRYSRPGGSGSSGGYRGHDWHGRYRGYNRYHGYGHYGWYGGFFPGLVVGGVLGWSLGPAYYDPPYYYPPPPEGNQEPQPPDLGSENRMFIYPRQGQSEEKQAQDFEECHGWAVSQTNFDPKKPPESGPDTQRTQNSVDYLRAISACLDARGYTVR